ncbi:MAG: hypothetical protein K0S32_3998 [Bacteroidetes bacterium]|jgi:uncharacterized protein (TIGR02145 family)|nr:hypothetical protein [Bacteroidota bacterium]
MRTKSFLVSLIVTLCVNVKAQDTAVIRTLIWSSKNLNVVTFRNGDTIPQASSDKAWKEAGEKGKPAWCYYNNDPKNGEKYGKLYNWHAVNDQRGLAPEGWHIASQKEWKELIGYLGGEGEGKAASRLKSSTEWEPPVSTTNKTNFAALPVGVRDRDGVFSQQQSALWWTSTADGNGGIIFYMVHKRGEISPGFGWAGSGYPVRCVKTLSATLPNEITIGKQIWATRNLDVTRFRNGDAITQAKTKEEWEAAGKSKKPAWCYYDNAPENGKHYGKLYNWYAVNDPRGLAPKGWHIPTTGEWQELIDFLGGGQKAAKQLLIIPGEYFSEPGKQSFRALPTSFRSDDGVFANYFSANWWSSTKGAEPKTAVYCGLYIPFEANISPGISLSETNVMEGYAVRCLKQ